jgi:hypothetical protein
LQSRVGRSGKPFNLYKFVTMLKNSPAIGTGTVTIKNDPRILPIGHFLRKTKINELPQLLNILFGDMSVIGPRPQTQRCFDAFTATSQAAIVQVRPGLSGIGSIIFRDEENLLHGQADSVRFYDEVIAPYIERVAHERRGATTPQACGQREHLLAQRHEVVGEARGLERGVEAAHEPAALRGDARRAVAGVALLGLDAADGQHRLARDVDHVAAERQGEQHLLGKPSLPEPMNTTFSCRPRSAKARYTSVKPSLKGSATWSLNTSGAAPVPPSPPSMVMKSGARARSCPSRARSSPEVHLAHGRLDAHRQPGRVGEPLDEVEHRVDVVKGRVRRGADAVLAPIGMPRIFAISGVIFAAGSTPPRPGLAPWLSLISMARTGALATVLDEALQEKFPFSSRQPK